MKLVVGKVIAIDGPAASGKSTVARCVASELGYLYVDSGSLYRGITWAALRKGVGPGDVKGLCHMFEDLHIDFFPSNGAVCLTMDGIEPEQELRTEEVNENVSRMSAVPEIRSRVVEWLRDMVRLGDLVMEGRDIGSAVFSDAPFKFYLDASLEERARRRHEEMVQRKEKISLAEVRASLERRDAIDSGRERDPLTVAPGAVIVDSTSMSIEEVIRTIMEKISSGPSMKTENK